MGSIRSVLDGEPTRRGKGPLMWPAIRQRGRVKPSEARERASRLRHRAAWPCRNCSSLRPYIRATGMGALARGRGLLGPGRIAPPISLMPCRVLPRRLRLRGIMRHAMEHGMMIRAVYCVAAIVGGAIGAVLALGANAALAAECLTEPNRDPPQGSHWFYRVDRATDHRCWYLRAWTPPTSPAPAGEAPRATPRPPAAPVVQHNRPPPGEPAPAVETRRATARSTAGQTGQRPRPPLSESDQAALFLEFLRWKEQQKSAQ